MCIAVVVDLAINDTGAVVNAFVPALEYRHGMNGKPYDLGLSKASFSKAKRCARIKRHVPDVTCVEPRYDE